MRLDKQELTLNTGQKILCEYDQDGDLLEIFFQQGEATCAVELTESIILRFDWKTDNPLSLSFVSISTLIQPTKYGEVHYQLLTEEWPDEVQDRVLTMLQKPPLTEFLMLSSYAPAHTQQLIPQATIKLPHLASLAA